jgi:anti-sigma B factor antagonist
MDGRDARPAPPQSGLNRSTPRPRIGTVDPMTRLSCPGCGIGVQTDGHDRAYECSSCGTAFALAADDQGFRALVSEDRVAVRVTVHGEIDLVTAPLLERNLLAAIAIGRDVVEVDLSAVTFMDARGVSALVNARNAVGDGSTLRLHAPSEPVVRMLELCGVDPLVGR